MPMIDTLLPEYDREMATTRRLLERVPDDRLDWKPHARSMSLGDLAIHLTNIPMWGRVTIAQPEIDITGDEPQPQIRSRADLLAAFDAHVAETRAALTGAGDAELMAMWTLKSKGQQVFSMPKAAVWRGFVMNHLVHHRGQLSVYLRLLDVPLPAIYGPSADEGAF
jgi:uncharacterized damage-inducible protein DinB